jgi:Putative FMN-binding domain
LRQPVAAGAPASLPGGSRGRSWTRRRRITDAVNWHTETLANRLWQRAAARCILVWEGSAARNLSTVYVPTHFVPADEDVQHLLAHHGAADLITDGPEGLAGTMLPFVYDRAGGTLLCHFARNNDHWKRADGRAGQVGVERPTPGGLVGGLLGGRGHDAPVSAAWAPVRAASLAVNRARSITARRWRPRQISAASS